MILIIHNVCFILSTAYSVLHFLDQFSLLVAFVCVESDHEVHWSLFNHFLITTPTNNKMIFHLLYTLMNLKELFIR